MLARTYRVCLSAAVAAGVMFLLASPAPAQDLSAKFEEWWARVQAAGLDNETLDGVRISYENEIKLNLSPVEAEELRKAVAGHPEHPDQGLLNTYDSQKSGVRGGWKHTLWRWRGMWRFNQEPLSGGGKYSDSVWGDGDAWVLGKISLLRMDPAKADQFPQYGLPGVSSGFTFDTFMIFGAGIGMADRNSVSLTPIMTSPTTWSVRGSSPDGRMTITAQGAWHEDEGWGTVDETRMVGDTANNTVKAWGWRFNAMARLGVPERVECRDDRNKNTRILTVQSLDPFDAAEFARVTTAPAFDGQDPVRGPVVFRQVHDLRGSKPVVIRDPSEAAAKAGAPPLTSDDASLDRFRIFGWVLAVSALTLTGLLWIRKHRASGPAAT